MITSTEISPKELTQKQRLKIALDIITEFNHTPGVNLLTFEVEGLLAHALEAEEERLSVYNYILEAKNEFINMISTGSYEGK